MENHQFVKIGSNCLFGSSGEIDHGLLQKKAQEIKDMDYPVSLVISGSIALGKRKLGVTTENKDLHPKTLQMLSGLGQVDLINLYQAAFGKAMMSQLLLTYSDIQNHGKDIKERIMIDCRHGIYTLINYNDGSDFEEIRQDNDILAARLLQFCGSARLVVLGRYYDGLQDSNGNLIEQISHVESQHYALCNGHSKNGSGGFTTKLKAAEIVLDAGAEMVVGNIRYDLSDIIEGRVRRTIFRNSASE